MNHSVPAKTAHSISLCSGLLLAIAMAASGTAFAAKGGGGGGGGKPAKTYSVGGTTSGISTGSAVTLQNNGSDDLTVTGDGTFTFRTKLPDGSTYNVTVSGTSDGLDCYVTNGEGSISGQNVTTVAVTCTSTTASYSVGGSLSGLASGATLTLQNNGGDNLLLDTNGNFSFTMPLSDGAAYAVTVLTQPDGQNCVVSSGTGMVSGSDVNSVAVSCEDVSFQISRLEGAGDSIMRGYNASCTGNTSFWDLFCYSGGDQNQNSFLDGSSSNVYSLLDRYRSLNAGFTGSKTASASGSEMTDPGKNNFATQASAIVAAVTQPATVVVELGGNDLCNRTANQGFYTDAQWQSAVDAGLQTLVEGLPDGSTVYLSSVPRVQDLRSVGLQKQSGEAGVDCQSFWNTWDVCTIATANDNYFSAIQERQRSYNQILVSRAAFFNDQALTTGVEVVAEYQGEGVASVGTYSFAPSEINGGDCFHPSISGQNKLSEVLWTNNPFKSP